MRYDVAVVGAGPAGSATAIAAARASLSVILFEREDKGRDKYCGGGITEAAKKWLAELGAKEAQETFEVICEGHVLVLPGLRLLIDRVRGNSYAMVRRCVFDTKLMEIAESYGARLLTATEVVSISTQKDYVLLMDRKGERYEASYVVLATGMRDRLVRSLGFPRIPPEHIGHCWGTEATYDSKRQIVKWRQSFGFTPIFIMFGIVTYGYFWVFPKASHMNVGMGTTLRESTKYRKLHKESYIRGLEVAKKLGVIDDTSRFSVNKGWILPARPRARTYSTDNRALLVGDAAGFVHPMTGEGISSALRSGMIAAETVKKALDLNDPTVLAEYERAWWKDFGRELFHYGVKLASLFYSSPRLLDLGLRGLMEDRHAVKLLSALLYRSDPRASEKLYKYVIKRAPLLLAKALKADKRRDYSDAP